MIYPLHSVRLEWNENSIRFDVPLDGKDFRWDTIGGFLSAVKAVFDSSLTVHESYGILQWKFIQIYGTKNSTFRLLLSQPMTGQRETAFLLL